MRRVQLAFFLVGCAALAWLVARLGPDRLAAGLAGVGWGFALTCGLHLTGLLFDSVVLRITAGPAGRTAPLTRYARASVTGHAINEATPLGNLGEVTKYAILVEAMPPAAAGGAVVARNILSFVVNCGLIAVGGPIALLWFGVSGAPAVAFALVSVGFLLAGAIGLVLLARGVGDWPFALLRRLRVAPERVDRWRAGWLKVEASWKTATSDRRAMVGAWLATIASRLTAVAETALLLHLLGGDQLLAAALLSLGTAQAVGWLLSIVPMQAGTGEGGAYLVFAAVGLAPELGVLIELGRKLRRVGFIALGVILLGWDTARRYRRAR